MPQGPAVTVDSTVLSDFGNVNVGDSSTPKQFSVSGTNLTANIIITAPTHFEVSTSSSSGFSGSVTLTQSGGTVNATTIYARFKPTSAGIMSGNIACTSTGAVTKNVAVSGTGVGGNSNSSDIILNAFFTAPTNIAYGSYQASDITDANSVEVARFDIRDGGGSADGDALATTLTGITFSLSNASYLRRVALYDGAAELGEQAAGATVSFSGLSEAAPDDGSKTFSLRATYASAVADNQQYQFAVTSATADGAGSTFAAANAGGAASSVNGDDNRIEVDATTLAFSAQPPASVFINADFAAGVEAVDANANRDVDCEIAISLSRGAGSGSLTSATGLTQSLASGVHAWTDLRYDTEESGIDIATGNGLGLGNATSASFSCVAPVFRSAATGNWDAAATWESYDGSSWAAATAKPGASNSVYIQDGHVVTLTGDEACKDFHLNVGADSIVTGASTLSVNGKVRSYSGTAGTIPGANSTTATKINTSGGGRISVIGNGRTVFNSGEWSANPQFWNLDISMNGGAVCTTATNLKAGHITVSSGTLFTGSAVVRPDSGTNLGTLIIASGASCITGTLSRTSAVTVQFGLLDVNGTLETNGANISAVAINVNSGGRLVSTRTGGSGITVTGTLSYAVGSALEYAGAAAQTTGGELLASHGNEVVVNNGGRAAVTLNKNLTIAGGGQLSMTRGSLALGAFGIGYASLGRLTYNGDTVQAAGAEWPAVSGPGVVTVANDSGVSLPGSRAVADTLVLANGPLAIGANTLTVSGQLLPGTGTLAGGATSNVVFDGSGAATALPEVGGNLNDLTIDRASGIITVGDVGVMGTLTLTSGTFSPGGGYTLTIGNPIAGTLSNFQPASDANLTVAGSGSGIKVPAATLAVLTLDNPNGLALAGDVSIGGSGQFALTQGAVATGGYRMIYAGSAALNYNGTAAQTTSAAEWPVTDGPNLVLVENASGISLHADRSVATDLYLAGPFHTGANTVTIPSGGTVTPNGGWVDGNLRRYAAAGSGGSLDFEMGANGGYSPLAVTFGTVTGAGYLTCAAAYDAGGYPSATTPENALTRFWTLTRDAALAFDDCSITLNYLGGDFNTDFEEVNAETLKCGCRYNDGTKAWRWDFFPNTVDTVANTVTVTGVAQTRLGQAGGQANPGADFIIGGSYYKLTGTSWSGVGNDTPAPALPRVLSLSRPYPNPARGRAVIGLGLPEARHVRMEVFNLLGQRIALPADRAYAAGTHQIAWDLRSDKGRRVSDGVYFYRLSAGDKTVTGRLTVLR